MNEIYIDGITYIHNGDGLWVDGFGELVDDDFAVMLDEISFSNMEDESMNSDWVSLTD